MCLLALFFRVVEDAPLVAGANREEVYGRGGDPPRLLDGAVRAVAGVDPLAGGTWFGVNEHGVLAAVTNRPRTQVPARPRSRGLLTRDLLNCASAAAALELATRELGQNRYAGCNVVCADRDRAYVIHAGDWLRVRPLPPGLHVLTAHDVNDGSDRRLGHALWWLGQRDYTASADCVRALREICAQPGNGDPPICLHGDKGGTVSSSIVALRYSLARSGYWHAQGPPDRTPYADYSHFLRELAPAPPGA
jgi:Transport and Golgi organisation 2